MTVNTKKAQGRRSVRYENLEDLWNDASRLAGSEYRLLGNWSLPQILQHLANSLDGSIDGLSFSLPAPMRWIMTLLMKRKMLEDSIPAGFSAPANMQAAEETTLESALTNLREAIDRQAAVNERVMHPAFGNIGKEGWAKFHLRHAEMHMSFAVPTKNATTAQAGSAPRAAEV